MLVGRGVNSAGPQGDLYYDNVRLLLKFEGDDGDTTTTDSSKYQHTISRVFGANAVAAKISTDEVGADASSTFLNSSSNLNGAGWEADSGQSTLVIDDNADWTIELWFNSVGPTSDLGPDQYLWDKRNAPTADGAGVYIAGNSTVNRRVYAYVNNSYIFTPLLQTMWTAGTWHHVALVRDSTTCYLYVDGVMNATTVNIGTNNVSFPDVPFTVGHRQAGNDHLQDNGCYIDDLRWTHGVCRYPGGTTFDPPVTAGGVGVPVTTWKRYQG